ncbi:hypothetical protein [Providencia stuartii]|uniref:hypothetical protein n=1 Tax=Providencia stuartii TaxID=588 RepID=UPI002989DF7C|nr:hypothetical protein [Providencia stuartii]HEM8343499.1 hypothetical protein [Providencia stuartii]HEM8346097.1 hypothetical protein [Providencia stuartii]
MTDLGGLSFPYSRVSDMDCCVDISAMLSSIFNPSPNSFIKIQLLGNVHTQDKDDRFDIYNQSVTCYNTHRNKGLSVSDDMQYLELIR